MYRTNKINKPALFLFIPTLFLLVNTAVTFSETQGGIRSPKAGFPVPLPARCSNPDCETSSPALADLTGDNIPEIIVATSNGHVLAVSNSGNILWDTDTSPYFGMAPHTQQINSGPAIGDIDNDGQPEVVVSTGTIFSNTCTQGGVIVLNHNGGVQSGWPFFTQDEFTPPSGCRDSIFSTPALGDLDKDGDMEIVVGGFDKRIYVLNHNGTLHTNFPIDSYHAIRFPTWDGLSGHLADTIWGSASLADMNGDGYLDILISTDEGNFDDNFPNGEGWDCPYSLPPHPWPQDYCGGALYVVDRFGNHLPGFPKRIHDTMQSSTAVVDIDGNGSPEIFVGGGTFYFNSSPDHPSTAFRIFGWDNEGNDLPGWEGGKVTGGSTPASPAVGDIFGDSTKEVVALGMDHKLYAWQANGSVVPGFPMTPVNMGGFSNQFDVGFSPLLGDYDGDNKMEIFFRNAANVTVVDGNGQQLTATQNPPNNPAFYTVSGLRNNAVLGDVDGNDGGQLELVAHNSNLYVWDLPNAGQVADWPMFRYNAARTGHPSVPTLVVTPPSMVKLHEIGDGSDVVFTLQVSGDDAAEIEWTATGENGVSASPNNGQVNGTVTTITVTVNRGSLSNGQNNKGITFSGEVGGNPVSNSPIDIPITIHLVNEVFDIYLPSVLK